MLRGLLKIKKWATRYYSVPVKGQHMSVGTYTNNHLNYHLFTLKAKVNINVTF